MNLGSSSNLYFGMQWKRAVLRPIFVCFLGALFLIPIIYSMPNYYTSTARVLPLANKGVGGLSGLAESAALLGLQLPGQDSGDSSAIDVINSQWLEKQLLTKNYKFHIKPFLSRSIVEREQTLYEYLGARNLDDGYKRLGDVLVVLRDQKTKLLVIAAETRSPDLSQQVAAKALDLLEQFNQMKGRTRGSFKAAFAESRLKEARSDMLNAEGALVDFVKVNRNYLASSDPAIRLYGLRLEAELKLQQQLVITLAMSREQALMEEKNDIPILNVLDEPAIPAIHSSPKRLRLLLVGLFLAILVVETVERSAKIKLLLSSRM